jgi:hypothetical protein
MREEKQTVKFWMWEMFPDLSWKISQLQTAVSLKIAIINALDPLKMGQQYYWAHAPATHNNECIP